MLKDIFSRVSYFYFSRYLSSKIEIILIFKISFSTLHSSYFTSSKCVHLKLVHQNISNQNWREKKMNTKMS